MPRGKKKIVEEMDTFVLPGTETETTLTRKECIELFINCRTFTQDQVAAALATMAVTDGVERDTVSKITATMESVISDSFSKIMATKL